MSYTFNISLSVLNHLGRNLYRNFITVIGEAISNSWDADANNVWINIDRESRSMTITDDGLGMSSDDFQYKFLKIGYSKRNSNQFHTAKGRPFIGRKGIGKLALLSCSNKIHIASKSLGCEIVGGLVDNSGLDEAIKDDISVTEYSLGEYGNDIEKNLVNYSSGTSLYFEGLNDGVINSINYLKKIIALDFRFSLIDQTFSIHLNGELIDLDALNDLASATQFVWQLNEIRDEYLSKKISPAINPNVKSYLSKTSTMKICGFIASTNTPSDLKIRGSNEKVSLDLFVNGRLREKDILKHIPTARIVESYLYGQIHYDALEYETDAFTSSREGIVKDDPIFSDFIKNFEAIIRGVIDEWDGLRRRVGNDGDPDNNAITKKRRKAQELFNVTAKEMVPSVPDKTVKSWVAQLSEEAQFNIPSYAECFIAENLLREFIRHQNISFSKEANEQAEHWKKREQTAKAAANIAYDIRQSREDLQYLDMDALSNLIDKPDNPTKDFGIARDAKVYKPMRDAVAHTSLITDTAKTQIELVSINIKARLRQLLDSCNDR